MIKKSEKHFLLQPEKILWLYEVQKQENNKKWKGRKKERFNEKEKNEQRKWGEGNVQMSQWNRIINKPTNKPTLLCIYYGKQLSKCKDKKQRISFFYFILD